MRAVPEVVGGPVTGGTGEGYVGATPRTAWSPVKGGLIGGVPLPVTPVGPQGIEEAVIAHESGVRFSMILGMLYGTGEIGLHGGAPSILPEQGVGSMVVPD